MARDGEDFLRRWSRRKLQADRAPPAAPRAADEPAPSLPSPDSLTFESDFKAFMHSKVEQGVKRAALKKLFSDPRFNVMDGLDVYIDDYSKDDPIAAEMMASMEHAKATLFGREPRPASRDDGGCAADRPVPGAAAQDGAPAPEANAQDEARAPEDSETQDGTAG